MNAELSTSSEISQATFGGFSRASVEAFVLPGGYVLLRLPPQHHGVLVRVGLPLEDEILWMNKVQISCFSLKSEASTRPRWPSVTRRTLSASSQRGKLHQRTVVSRTSPVKRPTRAGAADELYLLMVLLVVNSCDVERRTNRSLKGKQEEEIK